MIVWIRNVVITQLAHIHAHEWPAVARDTHWTHKRAIVTVIRFRLIRSTWTFSIIFSILIDDDECLLNRHNCIAPYECRNTKGSFRCDRPRTTTTTTTTTTTQRPVSTTKRSYIHAPYTPPQTYQTYSHRYTVWPTTTPIPRNADYDRVHGQCSVGFRRNSQGACTGEYHLYGNFCICDVEYIVMFFVKMSMNVLQVIHAEVIKGASTLMDHISAKTYSHAQAVMRPTMKEHNALVKMQL